MQTTVVGLAVFSDAKILIINQDCSRNQILDWLANSGSVTSDINFNLKVTDWHHFRNYASVKKKIEIQPRKGKSCKRGVKVSMEPKACMGSGCRP